MTDAEAMLEDCNKRYRKLTDWEKEFIDGLLRRKDNLRVSMTQYQKLEEIWERVT